MEEDGQTVLPLTCLLEDVGTRAVSSLFTVPSKGDNGNAEVAVIDPISESLRTGRCNRACSFNRYCKEAGKRKDCRISGSGFIEDEDTVTVTTGRSVVPVDSSKGQDTLPALV